MSKDYAIQKVMGQIKLGMEVYKSNEFYTIRIVDENPQEFVVRVRAKATRQLVRFITVDKYRKGYKRDILYILGNDRNMDLIAGWPGDMDKRTVTPQTHPNLFPTEAVVQANAAVIITTTRPTEYRLFQYDRGPLVLQGLFEWTGSDGTYGADWKDLTTAHPEKRCPVTFEDALRVKCPTCGALPGIMCTHIRGAFKGQLCSSTHNRRLREVKP